MSEDAKEEKVLETRKADKIPAKELTPNIMCPWFLPTLRKKIAFWYPGPEVCAHRMHWTEYLFGIFFVIAVLMMILGPFGSNISGALLAVNATLSLGFIWGYAKYKSLAELAERLERLAEENHHEVCAYQEINDEWDEGLKRGQENLNAFTSSLGLIQDDAESLNNLTDALSSMVLQKKKIQAEEKALFEIQKKHQRVTRAEIDEKERTTMKKQLTRFYDRIARASSADQTITGEDAISQLRQKLQENKFLNQTKPDSDEPMFAWLPEFESIADDGKVSKYELLDALDIASKSYFLEIKHARENTVKYEKELAALQKA